MDMDAADAALIPDPAKPALIETESEFPDASVRATGPVAHGTATGYEMDDPAPRFVPDTVETARSLDATAGLAELATVDVAQIEAATAVTWGGRALASYQLTVSEKTLPDSLRRFLDGDAFRHEAYEHAAMAEDDGRLLASIQSELGVARQAALDGLEAMAGA